MTLKEPGEPEVDEEEVAEFQNSNGESLPFGFNERNNDCNVMRIAQLPTNFRWPLEYFRASQLANLYFGLLQVTFLFT